MRHLLSALVLLAACGGAPATPNASAPASPAAAAPAAAPRAAASASEDAGKVVATGAGDPITLAEVDAEATDALVAAHQQIYDARKAALDKIVLDRLMEAEASKRGITKEALLKAEVDDKIAAVSDADVEAFYNQNKARMQGGSLEDMAARIKPFLEQQGKGKRMAEFSDSLRGAAGVKVLLDPPRVPVNVPSTSARLGPADAPVEIVEFSDFQCPYCSRGATTVHEIVAKYGDKVSVVFRNFPLEFHNRAPAAAQAAACMTDQGKFWEYHDKLFENQKDLSDEALATYAGAVGGDVDKFKACYDAGTHKDAIDADLAEGKSYGVRGTPGFFINGRMLSGAVPIEQFSEIIDDELARKM